MLVLIRRRAVVMKKFKLYAMVSGLALVSAGLIPAANAADMEPIVEEPASWTALHIGIGGGYGAALHDGSSEVDGGLGFISGGGTGFFLGDSFDDMGDRSGLLTVEAGFDWQASDRFVLGILGDFTWTNFDSNSDAASCVSNIGEDGFCVGSFTNVDVDNMWTIAGRFGFLSSPSTLWYGLAGWTRVNADARTRVLIGEDLDFVDAIDFSAGKDGHLDGFTVGAGVESMLTEALSLKLEYRFTDLGDFNYDGGGGGAGPGDIGGGGAGIDVEIDDTTIQTIRAVLSWRFNMFH
jgi:outer membrane immunogenic protein